jgi:hypothetical protein
VGEEGKGWEIRQVRMLVRGLVGGRARALKLSSKRRSEIARQAAITRWAKGKMG